MTFVSSTDRTCVVQQVRRTLFDERRAPVNVQLIENQNSGTRMTQVTIRERVLDHLKRTGISVAELSRRSGVSYNVLNKFKHRNGSTSAENGELLRAYLDAHEGKDAPTSQKRALVSRLIADLPEEDLDEALNMVRYLLSKTPDAGD